MRKTITACVGTGILLLDLAASAAAAHAEATCRSREDVEAFVARLNHGPAFAGRTLLIEPFERTDDGWRVFVRPQPDVPSLSVIYEIDARCAIVRRLPGR